MLYFHLSIQLPGSLYFDKIVLYYVVRIHIVVVCGLCYILQKQHFKIQIKHMFMLKLVLCFKLINIYYFIVVNFINKR